MTKLNLLSRAAAQVVAVLGVCLLAVACPASALAAGTANFASGENAPLTLPTTTSGSHAVSGGPSIARTIVGLAIVLAVIGGLYWVLRQVKASRDPRAPTDGLVSVAALTIASGRSVHLVRAGSDYVLLGSAEQGLVPIHRYTEQQAREAGLLGQPADPHSPVAAGQFNGQVRNPMGAVDPSASIVERVRQWTVRW